MFSVAIKWYSACINFAYYFSPRLFLRDTSVYSYGVTLCKTFQHESSILIFTCTWDSCTLPPSYEQKMNGTKNLSSQLALFFLMLLLLTYEVHCTRSNYYLKQHTYDVFVGQTFQQGILLLHLMLDDNGNPVDLMVEIL